MPERRRWFAVVAGLAALAPLAGPPAAAAAACGTVVLPSSLALGPPTSAISFHPVLATGSFPEENGIFSMFRPLVWVDDDRKVDPADSLAASIVPSDDDTRFTVTLRPWHWSDGTAVTAADVLYTWSLIRAEGRAYTDWGLGGVPQLIRSVAAPDPHTVVFTLARTVNPDWFIQLGLGQFTPLPRQAWGGIPIAEQRSRQSDASFYSVVDGAFRLQSFEPGRHAVFVPNAAYEGHHPVYRRLVVDFLGGFDPLEQLRRHDVDAAFLPFDVWKAGTRLGRDRLVPLGAQGSISTIELNYRNDKVAFFHDVRVRQAIARAIDQKRIVETAFHGQGLPQYGFVETAHASDIPPELRGGRGPLAYDPEAARALLDGAGYRPGPGGIRIGHGTRLAFKLLCDADAPDDLIVSELVEADLAHVGIAVSIKEVGINQMLARLAGGGVDWQAAFLPWGGGGYPDGTQWFASTSSYNFGGYRDAAMDRLLDGATARAGDAPLFALERYVVLQQPVIFLPDGDPSVLVAPSLHGIRRLSGPGGEFSPEYLTLDEASGCRATPGA